MTASDWCQAFRALNRADPSQTNQSTTTVTCATMDDHELVTALQQYVHVARLAQPELRIDDMELVGYLGARAAPGQLPPAEHAGDLALACGCARRDPVALAIFQRVYGEVIARVLSRRSNSSDIIDDAAQLVSERLFVAPAGALPKIANYRGSGPLKSWVASATARTMLMIQRASARRREESNDRDLAAEVHHADPEIALLQQRYKPDVEAAIVRALGTLGDQDRTLLRLHLGEHMSIDQLGVMYQINRATAARWLARARKALADGARDELRARFRLSESECNSVVALVRSVLDVSILRHL